MQKSMKLKSVINQSKHNSYMTGNNFSIKALLLWSIMITGSFGIVQAQRILDIDEVRVVAPYEPTISDAFKINLNPGIDDTISVELDFDYSIQPIKASTSFEPEPVSPARMRGEPLQRLYRAHLRGGYGNYQTPYFEAFYNSLRNDRYSLGLHLKHLSSGEDIDDYPFSNYSHNFANIYGTRFFRNTALKANLLYDRSVVHYYGIPYGAIIPESHESHNPLAPESAGDIRQRYELLSSGLDLYSHNSGRNGFEYKAGMGHNWLTNRHDGSEHHFTLTGGIKSDIAADPFGLADKQFFSVDFSGDYFYNTTPADTSNTGIYAVKPIINSSIDRLRFHIGVTLAVEDDNANYQMRAYPLAGFEVDIIPDRMTAIVDLSGGLERQSMYRLSEANPFISPSAEMRFSNIRSRLDGRIRGSIGDNISYSLGLTHSRTDNYPLFGKFYSGHIDFPEKDGSNENSEFIATWDMDNSFGVIYDNVDKLQIHAELLSEFGKRFSMRIRGDYFDYSLENQQKAWHQPDYKLSLNMKYNIQDKIILTADLFGLGQTYGPVFLADNGDFNHNQPEEFKLHDFFIDANAGIEYRYTRRLSVFLNFSNLQNESYERWLHYPVQGFNFLGGISYSF